MILCLLLYGDDILVANSSKKYIDNLNEILNGEFEMKDLSEANRILGMDITR